MSRGVHSISLDSKGRPFPLELSAPKLCNYVFESFVLFQPSKSFSLMITRSSHFWTALSELEWLSSL
jgi:hypothetical protein